MVTSRRSIVRIISFAIAAISVLGYMAYTNAREAKQLKQTLDYTYLRSVSDLATNVDNIKNTLSKGMYSGTPEMLQSLTSKLCTEASAAKSYLATLPVSELNLENTYKFLSQVGNYCSSLSTKANRGEALTTEDHENLSKLHEYCQSLSEDMWELESQIAGGFISFDKTKKTLAQTQDGENPTVANGFKEFEESFTDYPTLIYDGPFSDHILEREPLLIKNEKEVDRATARKKALAATGRESIGDDDNEKGKMPSYVFKGDGVTASITKAGGLLSYMIKSRDVLESNLTVDEAKEQAEKYINKLATGELTSTYYEIIDNVITINYAAIEGDITLYTDLIKVSVALDNGEILGFDARGYIVNHHKRDLSPPTISKNEAQASVSASLSVNGTKLAVIPTSGLNEVLTYEFSCVDRTGQKVLVYVNADTGREEQILILLISDSGVLTM